MAKNQLDPYTSDLFANLLPIEEVELVLSEMESSPNHLGGPTFDFQGSADAADSILTTAPSLSPERIEDFGQKIGGARKDTWQSYGASLRSSNDEDLAALPLSKVWPTPNYEVMLSEGVDAYSVALMRAVRESIPTKPKSPYKLKNWIGRTAALKTLCTDLLSGKQSVANIRQTIESSGSFKSIASKTQLYELLGHTHSLAHVQMSMHSYSMYKGISYSPSKLLWVLEEQISKTAWPKEVLAADTHAQLLEKITQQYDSLFSKEADRIAGKNKDPQFIIFSERKEIYIGKKIGAHYAKLAGPFEGAVVAREYRAANIATLKELLEQYKAIPTLRRAMNEERVGRDYRGHRDITPEQFAQAFGFKGVEFGNWVEQGRRQIDLNNAFDALMDLSTTLELPPKALSLNGQLSLAFGARGVGGVDPAAAHYEPGFVVINLTKAQGAGSLAHEWWHALDHYFSRENAQGLGYMTESLAHQRFSSMGMPARAESKIREQMVRAFTEVVSTIESSNLPKRSNILDLRRSKAYWGTRREMSARAFEAYVIESLHRGGMSNDYLANIVSQATWDTNSQAKVNMASTYPYPTLVEMPAITNAFDHFFETIQTQEVDQQVKVFCTRSDEVLRLDVGRSGQVHREWLGGASLGDDILGNGARLSIKEQVRQLTKHFLYQPTFSFDSDVVSRFGPLEGIDPKSVKGATTGGEIFIFTDCVSNELDLQRTVFHELLHCGLRRFLSEEEFIAQMHQLYERDSYVQERADEWVKSNPIGQEALRESGLSYAIARGVDEVLAEFAEERSQTTCSPEPSASSRFGKFVQNIQTWAAQLAERLGFKQYAADLRGRSNIEAIHFVDSIFQKLQINARPSPDPFQDHRYAFQVQEPETPFPRRNTMAPVNQNDTVNTVPLPVQLEKIYLAVPFEERNHAKELGAKWDPGVKLWFAPKGADLESLDKWIPTKQGDPSPIVGDPHAEFGQALQRAGLRIEGSPIMDGKLHRVPVEGKSITSKAGAYIGYLDGKPAGFIQNFVSGTKENWVQSGVQMSPGERITLLARAANEKAIRTAQLAEQREAVSIASNAKWEKLPIALEDNAYLARKGVAPIGVKADGVNLIVPMRDVSGKLWSLQTIAPEEGATKLFEKRGLKKGSFALLNPDNPNATLAQAIDSTKPLLVAEGYATGATLALATGRPVAVAFDANNLDAVVQSIQFKHPTLPIFIAADNDKEARRNIGVEKAMAAAKNHQVGIVLPKFEAHDVGTDFNDLAKSKGIETVKAQVNQALESTMLQSREQACLLVKTQMGQSALIQDAQEARQYAGKVLALSHYHVAQKIGKAEAVVHELAKLDRVPRVGRDLSIGYQKQTSDLTVGVVKPIFKNQTKDLQR